MQSAANLVIIMPDGGKHTYTNKGSNDSHRTIHALKKGTTHRSFPTKCIDRICRGGVPPPVAASPLEAIFQNCRLGANARHSETRARQRGVPPPATGYPGFRPRPQYCHSEGAKQLKNLCTAIICKAMILPCLQRQRSFTAFRMTILCFVLISNP